MMARQLLIVAGTGLDGCDKAVLASDSPHTHTVTAGTAGTLPNSVQGGSGHSEGLQSQDLC